MPEGMDRVRLCTAGTETGVLALSVGLISQGKVAATARRNGPCQLVYCWDWEVGPIRLVFSISRLSCKKASLLSMGYSDSHRPASGRYTSLTACARAGTHADLFVNQCSLHGNEVAMQGRKDCSRAACAWAGICGQILRQINALSLWVSAACVADKEIDRPSRHVSVW